MIALDDGALARLCIAAGAVPIAQRGRWLTDIAVRLERPAIEQRGPGVRRILGADAPGALGAPAGTERRGVRCF